MSAVSEGPLSFGQERLWFLDRLAPTSSAYVNAGGLALDGPLDVAALRSAVNGVVARHDSLRTRFTTVGGTPRRVVEDVHDLELVEVDRTGTPPQAREPATAQLAGELALSNPFRLDRGPLIRCYLLRWGAREHTLLFLKHHIVTDGWSLHLLFTEVAALYDGMSLPRLTARYDDYVRWQRDLTGYDDTGLAFWTEHLRDAPALLELPTDRPRPRVQTYAGATHAVRFGAELTDRLRHTARSLRATPFMVLQAVFASVLCRYAGTDEVVLGSPTAGRTDARFEQLIGFFVNTVATRTDITDDPSFAELVRRTRRTGFAALRHQDVPFEQVVQALGIERQAAHSPLFQVSFAVQNAPAAVPAMRGLRVRRVHVDMPASRFDLTASFTEEADRLCLRLQYNTDLFDAATIERLGRHVRVFATGAVGDPDRPVRSVPLLDEAETRSVLVDFQPPDLRPADDLVVRVEHQARLTPGARAVSCGDEALDYAALVTRAKAVAAALHRAGVSPGDRVGVCVARSIGLVPAILGVLLAGAVYLPLDPSHPAARRAATVRDADCRVAVCDPTTRSLAELPEVRLTRFDDAPFETSPVDLANLAYLFYTSGSTGVPKGVAVTHGNLAAFVEAVRRSVPFEPSDVVLAMTSVAFDISLLELLVPLTAGAEVRVVPGGSTDIAGVHAALDRQPRPTAVGGTPSTWQYLRHAGVHWPPGTRVLSGGERLSSAAAEGLLADGAELWNFYGPTEATVYVTATRVEAGGVPTIGRPLPGSRVYLLDERLAPVPVGVAGELFIGGRQVAAGYRNRPEETTKRFIRDPFTAEDARMYRTGDIARRRPDGSIDFLGRVDDEVKLHGFRLDPAEVESVLTRHPAVRQAAVVVREDRPGDHRLTAYLVPSGPISVPDLREHAATLLPRQVVPVAYVVLDAIPTTPNGKLDRRALPKPAAGAQPDDGTADSPTTAVLRSLFAEVLGLPEVGSSGHFFDLGGHSLLAIRLVGRISEELGVADVPLLIVTLFDHPTPAALAERIERR